MKKFAVPVLIALIVTVLALLPWNSAVFAQDLTAAGAAAAPAPTTAAPATAPVATAPAPAAPLVDLSILQSRADQLAAKSLEGTWICDLGNGRVMMVIDPQGSIRISKIIGTYRIDGNHIIITASGAHVTYQFSFDSTGLIFHGGDLRSDLHFVRETSVTDTLGKILEISPESIQHKLIRIAIAAGVVLGARFFIVFLQWIDHLLLNSRSGPLEMIYGKNKARARTVHSLILNGVKYVTYFTALGFILGELGINYTTYIASLSVLGLAIGIGSQGLVQDMVTGFFIILESQFDVGDMVEISGQTGIVLEFGLRTTTIINYVGQVIVIPNRNIAQVGRYKLNSQLALIDIRLASAKDVEVTNAVMVELGHEINAQFAGVLEQDPEISPTVTLSTGEVVTRLCVLFWPGQNWIVELQLVPRIRDALKVKGIDIPIERIVIFYHARQEQETEIDLHTRLEMLNRKVESLKQKAKSSMANSLHLDKA